ncbi:hypothetical protein B0H63DRAFT_542149 [Podospora didyma]|uniref:Uncharacterized protein n=1 Tax=Podospora didyma TaxID=330526 RepID=A0AAE0NU65_9PEZI|nr:hypothetical protein B0H63DRAFT_542149 [Podospora didyma]
MTANNPKDALQAGASDRLKIIMGVDYRTTFTGVSYVTSDKTSVDDIDVIRTWPGDGRPVEGNWKTPTIIAYATENRRPTDNRRAPGVMIAGAMKCAQDFLAEIYRYVVKNLKMRMTPEIFDTTPMECYLTAPAIWTDKARSATREAAIATGFGLRLGSVNAVQANDNIMILDCGGGIVDITTYPVQRVFPMIEFSEICVGAGGKCGSTYIDRNFLGLMSRRFGKAFGEVPLKRRGHGSQFMASFEKVKQAFGTAGHDAFGNDCFEIHPINMQGYFNPDHYDEDEAAVILSRDIGYL